MFVDKRKLYIMAAKRQMTITEVLQRAGITFQVLASVSRGWRSTTRTVGKLCRALDCEPADILRDEVGA